MVIKDNDKIKHVARIVKYEGPAKGRKIDAIWFDDVDDKYTKSKGIVYILTMDDKIMKIGGSGQNVKDCWSFYFNAWGGTPSPTRWCIGNMILEGMNNNHDFDLWVVDFYDYKVEVPGLFSNVTIKPSFNTVETACLSQFYELNDEYPSWNKKERGENWNDVFLLFPNDGTHGSRRLQA